MKLIDLTGQRFGRLTVIGRHAVNNNKKVLWKCVCHCGNEATVDGYLLRTGITTSCGCRKSEAGRENGKANLIDLVGKRFGKIIVVEWATNPKNGTHAWRCKCDCGKETFKKGSHLTKGKTISCGCYHKHEVSQRVKGEGNPMYGLPREKNPMMRAEVREKVSKALKGEGNPMYGRTMELNPAWKGGISFEPYCPKFDEAFKERIRDKFGRTCYTCPITESENGRRLCIHHIDYNKNSICNGKEWAFVPLCGKCHAKSGANRWYWFNLLINYWCERWLDGISLV